MVLLTPWWPRPTRTVAFFLAGVALFLALIWLVGAAAVGNLLRTVGWTAVLLPLPHVVVTMFETLGWWFAFSRRGCPLPFARLLRFTIAVRAIQGVTPSLSQ